MTEWFAFYERVATAGFPVVMFFLLVGSFLEIWVWGRTYRRDLAEMTAFYETRLAEWKARAEKDAAKLEGLQDALLHTTGLLDRTVTRFASKGSA